MQIKEVSYETIKNLGNYENEKVSFTAIVNEGENSQTVLAALQKEAMQFLHIAPVEEVKRPGA